MSWLELEGERSCLGLRERMFFLRECNCPHRVLPLLRLIPPAALASSLRELGCPRPVSSESFRAPNFALVAEILDWLVRKCVALARSLRSALL